MDRGTNSLRNIIDHELISNFQKPLATGVTDHFNTDGLKSTPGLCTANLQMGVF